ncbi:flagellar type III secretion system pore protein FliP [Campylobacter sp. faydin G-24]|uniref:Flagellar biosynthetic protein FliP n=1 Tax=Campylobacter anatolicus TaxID=2829105 RepID=A0ABS5HIC1_9BACT|nr:flagellar type III secretion system pore protein FliP [Campylobacter anatolicus]MBR8464014.1 flagellar type III secretion system pore protein FliP [Campylobacter anatolicus]MBR8465798.1 flagellar type III secretion system pore protein FliP [Campylobacter anatolicus]
MMKILLVLSAIFCISFGAEPIPTINLSLTAPDTPQQLVNSLNVLFFLTILTLAPSLVFMMTSFLRLIVVFSFLRQAMGTQQVPPSTVLISLAMMLTFFIMEPIATQSYNDGIKPYLAEQIGYEEAFDKSVKPFKEFMVKNTREKDLALFFRIRDMNNPANIDEIPLSIAMSAFMISELKTAFEIGFLIYLPFLVIDMVVSSVLMAMGMMMLPPVMISLPFKLLIFVLVDGWNLLIGNLVKSFH